MMSKDPKIMKAALKGLAESMAKLHLDKIKGYKRVPGMEEEEEDEEDEREKLVKVLEARKEIK